MTTAQPTLRTYFIIYALLMLGLALTVAAAYVPLGRMNLAVAMAIAFAKAALVVMFFMHVLYSPKLTWIAVFAGLVWLAILLALVGADYATRGWIPVEPPAVSLKKTSGSLPLEGRAGEGVGRWYTLQSPLPNPARRGKGIGETILMGYRPLIGEQP